MERKWNADSKNDIYGISSDLSYKQDITEKSCNTINISFVQLMLLEQMLPKITNLSRYSITLSCIKNLQIKLLHEERQFKKHISIRGRYTHSIIFTIQTYMKYMINFRCVFSQAKSVSIFIVQKRKLWWSGRTDVSIYDIFWTLK